MKKTQRIDLEELRRERSDPSTEITRRNEQDRQVLARLQQWLLTSINRPLPTPAWVLDQRKTIAPDAQQPRSLRAGIARLFKRETLPLELDTLHDDVAADYDSYRAGKTEGIVAWLLHILEAESLPWPLDNRAHATFDAASRQLIVEVELPPLDVVPAAKSYRYDKANNEIVGVLRPTSQRAALYTDFIAQLTLSDLHRMFLGDDLRHVDSIVINGYVRGIDPATGRDIRPCVLSARVTREQFEAIDLARADAIACLGAFHAAVSTKPGDLIPVRPIVELSMTDARFVPHDDILTALDQRPNLLALTPSEFETLITNLFAKMGLETRLTRASRDGGVDCVAFDLRPVLGGKIVIQAKRYADTVGVSAVRDLYGTVLNEGAGKGILVTTSGFGQAAFNFAANKPLELLSGANLLALLADHAGVEAMIRPVDETVSTELANARLR